MKIVNQTIAVLASILAVSCGSPFAGTGQQGEARIIGVAMTSTGVPAANQALAVTGGSSQVSGMVYTQAVSNSAVKPDTVFTDKSGRFVIAAEPGKSVIISGRVGSDFLYIKAVSADRGDRDLGSVSFSRGTEVKVYPWWNKDGKNDQFTVKGTDWTFSIPDDAVSSFWIPSDSVDLIHYGQTGEETVAVDGTGSGSSEGSVGIGDPGKWDTTKTDTSILKRDTLYVLPDSAAVGDRVILRLADSALITDRYAQVLWGDGSAEEKSDSASIYHVFDRSGLYTVYVQLIKRSSDGTVSSMEPIQSWKKQISIKDTVNMNDTAITRTDSTAFPK